MKDLVPKGTGNSRFLRSSIPENITHAELVALLRAGTFPVDFAGLNAEGVAVVGSAYNKANVLPDDVCAVLGVPTSAEPKDAFSKLANANRAYKLLEKITTSKQWTCPDGVFCITALIVGGGGGGGAVKEDIYRGGGGQGGACLIARDVRVIPGKSYPITIGAGGNGGTPEAQPGSKGGDTEAFGFTAFGGDPGKTNGGSNPLAGSYGGRSIDDAGYGGPSNCSYQVSDGIVLTTSRAERLYTDPLYMDWYGSGGGAGRSGSEKNKGGPNAGDGGKQESDGSPAPSGFGGGGGGASGRTGVTRKYSGGNGGSGAVLIYVRGD